MGNRLTENGKRSIRASYAAMACPRCVTDEAPYLLCDLHRCSAATKRGTRCANAATYPESGACGIHRPKDREP